MRVVGRLVRGRVRIHGWGEEEGENQLRSLRASDTSRQQQQQQTLTPCLLLAIYGGLEPPGRAAADERCRAAHGSCSAPPALTESRLL